MGRDNDFIWKASRRRSWGTSVPKNHLPQVRTQASFIPKGEGVKSWFQPDSGGVVFISPSPQSFTGGPGQDVSCELNKGILAYHSFSGRQGSQRWAIMYTLSL